MRRRSAICAGLFTIFRRSRAALRQLHRGARHRAVGTEHATIARQGLERLPAALASVKEAAGIDRHLLGRSMPTPRAGEYGFGLNERTRAISVRHGLNHRQYDRGDERTGGDCGRVGQRLLVRHLHQHGQSDPQQVEAVKPQDQQKAQARDEQKNAGEPERRVRIGRELHGVGKILLGAETRREQIDHSGNDVHHGKGDEVEDDRAQEIWNDRRIAADERLADEVGDFRDCCEDRNVADQQIEQRVVLPPSIPFAASAGSL